MSHLRVPLVNTAALSEFGDVTDQAAFYDPNGMDRDQTYVPGFSEMKRTAAIQMAEVRKGLRQPKDIQALPVNLRWARNQNIKGDPDSSKQFGHSRKGYRLVTKADLDSKPAWLTEIPPGCQINADGTIRNGDAVLMVCDAAQARKNEFTKRHETERQVKGAEGAFASLVESARGVSAGAAPYTKIEPGASPAKK